MLFCEIVPTIGTERQISGLVQLHSTCIKELCDKPTHQLRLLKILNRSTLQHTSLLK
jgi:hypothetical protein